MAEQRISEAANNTRDEDLAANNTRDEDLSVALEEAQTLAEELQFTNDALLAANQQLDLRVAERTDALDQANAALELMNADLQRRVDVETAARHEAQEQLRQAQKMDAIGNLAGGIAHDFNNLLSVILSYSHMLAEDMTPSDPRRADLEEIEAAGKRAVELTRQLLAFGRQQILQPKIVNLNVHPERDEPDAPPADRRRRGGHDCRGPSARTGQGGPGAGRADRHEPRRERARRDAQGGKLTIETANVELDETYASEHVGATAGPHVMIAVTDTGTGMDRVTLARMFEPFFTTKEAGKGTGLGLAHRLRHRQAERRDDLGRQPAGRRTSVHILLPRSRREALPEPIPASISAEFTPHRPGDMSVLVVEDDEAVAAVVVEMLGNSGTIHSTSIPSALRWACCRASTGSTSCSPTCCCRAAAVVWTLRAKSLGGS